MEDDGGSRGCRQGSRSTQGWMLLTGKSELFDWHDTAINVYKLPKSKEWICSKGDEILREQHSCDTPKPETEDSCEEINTAGLLCQPDEFVAGEAARKTGCPVRVCVTAITKKKPEGGWPVGDGPIMGYKLATPPEQLKPCRHNHRSCHPEHIGVYESIRQVRKDLRDIVKTMMIAQIAPDRIREYLRLEDQPAFTQSAWQSLISATKDEIRKDKPVTDQTILIDRLRMEHFGFGGILEFCADEINKDKVGCIFSMTSAMLRSFQRCGQFVVIDCSNVKETRFGMHVFLIGGYDEHLQWSLFAVALLQNTSQASLEFVLSKMKNAVGDEAWNRLTCVATDGSTAITNVVSLLAPHACQQRYVTQLQQTTGQQTGLKSKHHFRLWNRCVEADSVQKFEEEWKVLMNQELTAKVREHFTEQIYPIRQSWSAAWTSRNTNFGNLSVQIFKPLGRLLHMCNPGHETAIATVIHRLTSVADKISTMRKVSPSDSCSKGIADLFRGLASECAVTLLYEEFERFCDLKATLISTSSIDLQSPFPVPTETYLVAHRSFWTPSVDPIPTDQVVPPVQRSFLQFVVHFSPTAIFCPCGFTTKYLLPCRHVFAAAHQAGFSLVQKGQLHPRWHVGYNTYSVDQVASILAKQMWLQLSVETSEKGVMKGGQIIPQQLCLRRDPVPEESTSSEPAMMEIDPPTSISVSALSASTLASSIVQTQKQTTAVTSAEAAAATTTQLDYNTLRPEDFHQLTLQQQQEMLQAKCESLLRKFNNHPSTCAGNLDLGLTLLKGFDDLLAKLETESHDSQVKEKSQPQVSTGGRGAAARGKRKSSVVAGGITKKVTLDPTAASVADECNG